MKDLDLDIAGRDVPCEIVCPCLSIPQFTAMLANANYCYADLPLLHALSVEPEGPNEEPPPQYSATSSLGACGYVDEVTPANTIILLATPDQVEACLQVMADATASRGPSWAQAIAIQSEMFREAASVGGHLIDPTIAYVSGEVVARGADARPGARGRGSHDASPRPRSWP